MGNVESGDGSLVSAFNQATSASKALENMKPAIDKWEKANIESLEQLKTQISMAEKVLDQGGKVGITISAAEKQVNLSVEASLQSLDLIISQAKGRTTPEVDKAISVLVAKTKPVVVDLQKQVLADLAKFATEQVGKATGGSKETLKKVTKNIEDAQAKIKENANKARSAMDDFNKNLEASKTKLLEAFSGMDTVTKELIENNQKEFQKLQKELQDTGKDSQDLLASIEKRTKDFSENLKTKMKEATAECSKHLASAAAAELAKLATESMGGSMSDSGMSAGMGAW